MPERPHSRKVKIEQGTVEVKKGERLETQVHASEGMPGDGRQEQQEEQEKN